MYSYIINPITNQKVNISSNLAKNIIKKYIKNLNGGAGNKTITVEWGYELFAFKNVTMDLP